jgi:hypothetical protein
MSNVNNANDEVKESELSGTRIYRTSLNRLDRLGARLLLSGRTPKGKRDWAQQDILEECFEALEQKLDLESLAGNP